MFLTGQLPILLCVIAMDLLLEVVTDLLIVIISDIISLPVKNGVRLEIGWILRQKHTLSDTASRFVELLMQNEAVFM